MQRKRTAGPPQTINLNQGWNATGFVRFLPLGGSQPPDFCVETGRARSVEFQTTPTPTNGTRTNVRHCLATLAAPFIFDARLDDHPRNRSSSRGGFRTSKNAWSFAQDTLAIVPARRRRLRGLLPFSDQVVSGFGDLLARSLKAVFAGAVLLVLSSAMGLAGDVISDVTFRTGFQLKDRAVEVLANPDVKTAVNYYVERKLSEDFANLVEIRFRANNEPEQRTLLFIPFKDRDAKDLVHLVVLAQSQKNSRVFLGTVSTEAKQPEVKAESEVVEGKVQPGQDRLKSFLKCAIAGCGSAGLGCVYGAPAWLPCFCFMVSRQRSDLRST